MAPLVEKILSIPQCQLGEAPHWDVPSQSLYMVDIFGHTIHNYKPSTGKHTKVVLETDNKIGFVIPVKGKPNQFVTTIGRDLVSITWDGKSDKVSSTKKLLEVDNTPATLDNSLNDGKCDSSGRLWTGTLGGLDENGGIKKNSGQFLSFENGVAKTHLTQIGVSNGLAFNDKAKKFYYIDSHTNTIDQFDFDIVNGTISNRQVIFSLEKHGIPGFPDGMCIDADGNLWAAIFNGGKVIKIDPRKTDTLLQVIDIPAIQVTSLAFGGANLDELYVTTGALKAFGADPAIPENGATYKISGLGVKGLAGENVKL